MNGEAGPLNLRQRGVEAARLVEMRPKDTISHSLIIQNNRLGMVR